MHVNITCSLYYGIIICSLLDDIMCISNLLNPIDVDQLCLTVFVVSTFQLVIRFKKIDILRISPFAENSKVKRIFIISNV